MGVLHGYSVAPEQDISAAFEAAQAALVIDDKHAGAHFSLGRAYILKRDLDAAIAELQTAVALNPSFADAYYGLSMALLYAGGPEESIVAMDHALRLSPHDPYHWIFLRYPRRPLRLRGVMTRPWRTPMTRRAIQAPS
jgi:tetratricopeptide (TPR) repeat protein